jgi:hypothetical protein
VLAMLRRLPISYIAGAFVVDLTGDAASCCGCPRLARLMLALSFLLFLFAMRNVTSVTDAVVYLRASSVCLCVDCRC